MLTRPGLFGEPVSGFHLVDGRASYGIGLQFFFLGYPLHFDWSKLTDLKVVSDMAGSPSGSASTSSPSERPRPGLTADRGRAKVLRFDGSSKEAAPCTRS